MREGEVNFITVKRFRSRNELKTLKTIQKRIGVEHENDDGNYDVCYDGKSGPG